MHAVVLARRANTAYPETVDCSGEWRSRWKFGI